MFGYHTPESSIARSDSKNPATTCKGITSVGRPCRRALGTSASRFSPTKENGVFAILDAGEAAAFFCWQHKEQANLLAAGSQERTTILPLKGQSSLDELAERVGVLDLQENITSVEDHGHTPKRDRETAGVRKSNQLPSPWQKIHGPVMTVSKDLLQDENLQQFAGYQRKSKNKHADTKRSNVKASWGCCIVADDEYERLPARRRRHDEIPRTAHKQQSTVVHESAASYRMPSTCQQMSTCEDSVRGLMSQTRSNHQSDHNTKRSTQSHSLPATPTRPQLKPRHSSTSPPNTQTMTFLSYIPPHLSPSTTSALLTELSRPISEADEEGYIYIFWLTAESEMTKPDDETASHLLDDEEDYDDHNRRSPSYTKLSRSGRPLGSSNGRTHTANHILQRYASVRRHPKEPDKILLKIGRATNVHRRLTQWTKQCGQNLTLIRYYPYASSHAAYSTNAASQKAQSTSHKGPVPHVHRVERLIHIELAGKRATDKDECEACGRLHKEWFEIEATRQGLQDVDEVIRRWVDWSYNHQRTSTY